MKIGIFISPAHPVPPDPDKILAPWVIAKEQSDSLNERGHDVHVFAAMGSQTSGTLHDFGIQPLVRKQELFNPDEYKEMVAEEERIFFLKSYEEAKQIGIDIFHIHHPIERLYEQYAHTDRSIPLVFTFHDPIGPERWDMLGKISSLGNCHFVSISNSQREKAPFPFVGTVYNGVPLQLFAFQDTVPASAMLLGVGRIVPQKGYDDSIAVARATGMRLMIAGQVFEEKPEAKEYYETKIKPAIDGKIVFLEPVLRRDHLCGHYQSAKVLTFPISWEEPFGLVMIEAMACGTPVVAYARGSIPEVVKDGETGFIVNPSDDDRRGDWVIKKSGLEGLVEAVNRINAMDSMRYGQVRHACRRHVEENFTVDKMVENYEKVYRKITGLA